MPDLVALHYLYRYGTVFSPHGENAILVHRDGVPARLALKDFVDDVNLSDQPLPELEGVPAEVAGLLLREPPAWLCQFLQASLFVGHFRYLADLIVKVRVFNNVGHVVTAAVRINCTIDVLPAAATTPTALREQVAKALHQVG